MCECCSADTEDIGRFAPGWTLVRARRDGRYMKAGQYGLHTYNDPDYVLTITPYPEPRVQWEKPKEWYAKRPGYFDAWRAWKDVADQIDADLRRAVHPMTAWCLVDACDKAGYDDEEKLLHHWLTDRLGRVIRRYERRMEQAED
jgi:hypothetical protein